jgi:hypothetical protein
MCHLENATTDAEDPGCFPMSHLLRLFFLLVQGEVAKGAGGQSSFTWPSGLENLEHQVWATGFSLGCGKTPFRHSKSFFMKRIMCVLGGVDVFGERG